MTPPPEAPDHFEIREARDGDVDPIRHIFRATYDQDYPHREFYGEDSLRKLIYSDDTLMFVAVEPRSDLVVGTGSVMLEFGAYSDLVGEFGRLAVHPDFRSRGVASRLMQARCEAVAGRLHVGLVEARSAHDHSQRNAERHGFAVVGFLPLKLEFAARESSALLARYFGPALALRRNNPRLIPEAYPVAALALENAGLPIDPVVDDRSPPYPPAGDFRLETLTTRGYATLLRMERGRVRHREVFGPMRLHYGFFKLRASHSSYLVAWDGHRMVGAVGFMRDRLEHTVRVFELIVLHDEVVRFLIHSLIDRCRTEWQVAYVEVDVNADAPRMQRTLIELGFLPAAYVPAMAFLDVERVDVVKMVQLVPAVEEWPAALTAAGKRMADVVRRGLDVRPVAPDLSAALRMPPLFDGLNADQTARVVSLGQRRQFNPRDRVFNEGDAAGELYLILEGEVHVTMGEADRWCGVVAPGECLGELALVLDGTTHSATATAHTCVDALRFERGDMESLIRRRPDIGVVLLRNLARDLGHKLRSMDLARMR